MTNTAASPISKEFAAELTQALTLPTVALAALGKLSILARDDDEAQNEFMDLAAHTIQRISDEMQGVLAAIQTGRPYRECLAEYVARQ